MSTKPFILLGLLLILICPAMAGYVVTGNYAGDAGAGLPVTQNGITSFTYSPETTNAISVVQYSLPINTRTDFTLTYGTGATVAGYIEYYSGTGIGNSTSTVSLGGMTRTTNFIDAQAYGYALTKNVKFSSYGINTSASPATTGFTLYSQGYGLYSSEIAFFEVPEIENNMISSISISSTKPIDIVIENSDRSQLSQTLRQGAASYQQNAITGTIDELKSWLDLAWQAGNTLFNIVVTLLYYLKFFFWDHIILTFALYIGITGAVAFSKKGDIFSKIKTFFRYQRSLIEFILNLWQRLIDLIASFRGIFRI